MMIMAHIIEVHSLSSDKHLYHLHNFHHWKSHTHTLNHRCHCQCVCLGTHLFVMFALHSGENMNGLTCGSLYDLGKIV